MASSAAGPNVCSSHRAPFLTCRVCVLHTRISSCGFHLKFYISRGIYLFELTACRFIMRLDNFVFRFVLCRNKVFFNMTDLCIHTSIHNVWKELVLKMKGLKLWLMNSCTNISKVYSAVWFVFCPMIWINEKYDAQNSIEKDLLTHQTTSLLKIIILMFDIDSLVTLNKQPGALQSCSTSNYGHSFTKGHSKQTRTIYPKRSHETHPRSHTYI